MFDFYKTTVVMYHKSCLDGFFAAAALWRLLLAAGPAEPVITTEKQTTVLNGVKFIPIQYGMTPPSCKGETVVILDFAFSLPVMLQLITETNGNLLVIDHHDTSARVLAELPDQYKIFSNAYCGAVLTWGALATACPDFWIPVHINSMLLYTNAHDLWLKKSGLDFKEFRSGFEKLFGFSLQASQVWLTSSIDGNGRDIIDRIIEAGRPIVAQLQKQAEDTLKRTGFFAAKDPLDRQAVLIVGFFSGTGNDAADYILTTHPQVDVFAFWYVDQLSGETQFSLRSREGGYPVHVLAETLVKYNPIAISGGGHAAAAGLRLAIPAHRLPLVYYDVRVIHLLLKGDPVTFSAKDTAIMTVLQTKFPNAVLATESYTLVRNGLVIYQGDVKPTTTQAGDVVTTVTGGYAKATVVS